MEPAEPDPAHVFQAILDGIPAPIFYKDAEGVYRGCNRAFVEYLGRSREEIIGRTVYDVAPQALAETYDAADRALLASRGVQIYESAVRYADGSIRDVIFHKGVFLDERGEVGGQVGTILDITACKRAEKAQRESEERLAYQSLFDALTGLPNRVLFERRLKEALASASSDSGFALLFIDLDRFKSVNDTLGHGAGDALLQQVASRLAEHMRVGDTLARMGGDEFTCILGEVRDVEAAARWPSASSTPAARPSTSTATRSSSARAWASASGRSTARTRACSCAAPTARCTAPRSAARIASASTRRTWPPPRPRR